MEAPRRRPRRDDHTEWNFAVIGAESAVFQAGMMWADPVTVLPLFIGRLGGSTVLVGLVTVLQRLGWILPQLPMAAVVGHRPNRLPYLRWGVLLFRMPFLVFVAYLWLVGATSPATVLTFMLLAYFSVALGNGVVALPWQDIIAKSIPAEIRGRFFGVMQFAAASMQIGIGFAVRYLLGPGAPAFPMNYATLFSLTAVFFALSTVGCWLVREPIRPVLDRPESIGEIVAGIGPFLRRELGFRYLTLIAMLGMGMSLTTPFYIVYATRQLGVAPQTAGVYIWAATIGGAMSSMVWGRLNDRRGPRAAIRGGTMCTLLAPALALVVPPLARGLEVMLGRQGAVLPYLFGLVFLAAGSSMNGLWIGTNNYLFDLASHQERPRYIAILNTLAMPGALIPLAVGVALKGVPYPVVFAALTLIGGVVLSLAWRMPRPRRSVGVA